MPDQVRRLLDQFGEPIPPWQVQAMGEEISPVGAVHGRPPFPGDLAFGINPGRLGAIIRAADGGNTYEWMIIAEQIEEMFPHYYSVLSKRRRQVSQLPVTVEAADIPDGEKHADFIRDWLNDRVLARSMFDVTDAIGKGFSVSEIIWDSSPGRIVPAEILYRPQRFYELSWKDGAKLWMRSDQGFVDLVDHKFLVHTHRSKSGLVARSGLTRAVAFLWLYAIYTARDWALFVQAYGMPIRLGRYGPEASEPDKRVLWRAVSSIAGDVAAIIPKSMEVEFVKGAEGATAYKVYEERSDWLNREVSKLVLGSTAGTEAIRGGHAVGQEHRQVEQDVEKFDADLLSTSATRQLGQPMIAFTFGPQEKYPVLVVGQPERIPLKDFIAGAADFMDRGLRVKANQIRERLELDEPDEGDETIGGAPPATTIHGPAVTPPDNAQSFFGRLVTRHAVATPVVMDQLTERLAQDAAGALGGLTERVRHAFEQATDLHDLAQRVHALKLPKAEFAEAMARGMALAHLVGQAELVDELGHGVSRHANLHRPSADLHAELTAAQRDALDDNEFAVPGKRELPMKDRRHVKLAWDMVDRTEGLTDDEKREARRRILRRAKRLKVDTRGWDR